MKSRLLTMVYRRFLAALVAGSLALALSGCQRDTRWHMTNITGSLPSLAFRMARTSDGQSVTAQAYRGDLVLLYFGFTQCYDVCPLTLYHLAQVLATLGPEAEHVKVLFVTVDPARDNLPTLRSYLAAFGPNMVGLRGDPDALTALARRYRVAFAAGRTSHDAPYIVTHSSAVFVFDQQGRARLVATDTSDIDAIASDLKRLLVPGFRNS